LSISIVISIEVSSSTEVASTRPIFVKVVHVPYYTTLLGDDVILGKISDYLLTNEENAFNGGVNVIGRVNVFKKAVAGIVLGKMVDIYKWIVVGFGVVDVVFYICPTFISPVATLDWRKIDCTLSEVSTGRGDGGNKDN
jgi:hypothetical protein